MKSELEEDTLALAGMNCPSVDLMARAMRSKTKVVFIEAVVEGVTRRLCLCWMRSGWK